jgi:hypothetical protein
MRKLLVPTVVLFAAFAASTAAEAGCSCTCFDGKVQATCSGGAVPPICSQSPCAFGPVSTSPPLALRHSSCHQVHECDVYANCKWKEVCS